MDRYDMYRKRDERMVSTPTANRLPGLNLATRVLAVSSQFDS